MTNNSMLSLRLPKHLRAKINALRRGTKPRKSQADIVRAALEALPDPRAGGAAAPRQTHEATKNTGQNEHAPAS